MACSKCNRQSCSGNCVTNKIIKSENKSIGKDGEDAYDAYVRAGGTMTKEQWALSTNSNIYSKFDW